MRYGMGRQREHHQQFGKGAHYITKLLDLIDGITIQWEEDELELLLSDVNACPLLTASS